MRNKIFIYPASFFPHTTHTHTHKILYVHSISLLFLVEKLAANHFWMVMDSWVNAHALHAANHL